MARILIIDDDFATQLLLKRTLEQQGYHVTLANDGEEGLVKAKELSPALIICDWIMPGINGLEVCRQLKLIPELSTTFFILLTSLDSVEARVKGLDAGSDDFLCKPIEMYELKARVRAGLRLHQLSRDLQQQKQLLEAELAEAAEYVSSILPEPLNHQKLTISTHFVPSRQLGGDSFDYFWLDPENLVFYLLDVSGHGLRASLASLSVINLLRSRSLGQVDYYQPSTVLSRLNETFQMSDRNDKYFTIWYGVYNYPEKKLTYSSAGHPPAIFLTYNQQNEIKNQIIEQRLKTPGFPVGMFLEAKYVDSVFQVTSPSNLYLFSDGIYELEQEEGSFWGLEKFISLLKKYQQTPDRHLERLIQYVRDWHPKFQFEDDLSIMQIEFL
ncbi:MAG: SpoIIE family protein phosphatase [Xenococcaceae cyanobacterium MO_234.B1]|nr:SpoIIE family protein phosphatase [Xenococcaceae cyanobacterium MO_234.B1]